MKVKFTWKRFGYAVLGFAAGVVVSPLAVFAAPILLAYWQYIYGEED